MLEFRKPAAAPGIWEFDGSGTPRDLEHEPPEFGNLTIPEPSIPRAMWEFHNSGANDAIAHASLLSLVNDDLQVVLHGHRLNHLGRNPLDVASAAAAAQQLQSLTETNHGLHTQPSLQVRTGSKCLDTKCPDDCSMVIMQGCGMSCNNHINIVGFHVAASLASQAKG
jgi:hypothetical protein